MKLVIPLIAAMLALGALRIPRAPGRSSALPQALYSHARHDRFHCYACHPTLFPQAPAAFTHEDMRAGKFCGACHDGTRAAAIESLSCEACHVP